MDWFVVFGTAVLGESLLPVIAGNFNFKSFNIATGEVLMTLPVSYIAYSLFPDWNLVLLGLLVVPISTGLQYLYIIKKYTY